MITFQIGCSCHPGIGYFLYFIPLEMARASSLFATGTMKLDLFFASFSEQRTGVPTAGLFPVTWCFTFDSTMQEIHCARFQDQDHTECLCLCAQRKALYMSDVLRYAPTKPRFPPQKPNKKPLDVGVCVSNANQKARKKCVHCRNV